MYNTGWDTETILIAAPDDIIPRLICSSYDIAAQGVTQTGETFVQSSVDTAFFNSLLNNWQAAYEQNNRIIIHNAAFDVTVLMRYLWEIGLGAREGDKTKARDFYYLIWDTLEKSMDNEWQAAQLITRYRDNADKIQDLPPVLVSDTIIREKLKNLSAHGGITVVQFGKLQYGLANLVQLYFKQNIFDKKVSIDQNGRYLDKDGNDITGTPQAAAAWRLDYWRLDGIPVSQWPKEAYDYALSDATWARKIWEAQEAKRQLHGHYSMNSEALQVYTSICLQLSTAHGFQIEEAQRDKITKKIDEQLEKLNPVLFNQGILRSNGSINKKVVEERVVDIWENQLDRQPIITEKGNIATKKEVLEILSDYDPMLETYAKRQKLAKVRDAFLPPLQGKRVWTTFDVLKETGRTSSRGLDKSKKRTQLFPSINSQQIPREPGVREIMTAGEGFLTGSVDYGTLELASTAQVTYKLFGQSEHRNRLLAGYDLHAYLASRVCMLVDPQLVDEWRTDPDAAYQAFEAYRKDRLEDVDINSPEGQTRLKLKKRAKERRNLAKPIGLGYPGGLGVRTMPVFAKTVYGVVITETQSEQLREIWFETYPEMRRYFSWVKKQKDPKSNLGNYFYETPGLLRFRSNCPYCATANGMAMQSLSADGAKRSVCWLGRACASGLRDDNPFRILDACKPLTFIHDENLIGVPNDALATARIATLQRLMILAMNVHMPDVPIRTEGALMTHWSKGAEEKWVYDPDTYTRAQQLSLEQYGEDLVSMFQPSQGPGHVLEVYRPLEEEN